MIEVRDARMSDARNLWRWANDPDTRRWSFSTDPIPWEDHLAWLSRTIDNPYRMLLIGYDQWGDIGTVRFDVDSDVCEVSITVAPECRGQGLSRMLLDVALPEAPCGRIVAQVKSGNAASLALFAGWGQAEAESVVTFTAEMT